MKYWNIRASQSYVILCLGLRHFPGRIMADGLPFPLFYISSTFLLAFLNQ